MRRKQLEISIKNPCSESFDEFKMTTKGGFCNLCSKEVVDFTNMSDEKIIEYFKVSKKETCGRFKETQLHTFKALEKEHKSVFASYRTHIMSFSLLSLLTLGKTYAQKETKNTHETFLEQKSTDSIKNSNDNFYRGIIKDEHGYPLPGVSVLVKGTDYGTVTDFDGYYQLSKEKIDKNSILVASFIGFESIEFKVKDFNKTLKQNTEMKEMVCVTMGEVAVDEVYSSSPNFFQKLFSWFK